MVMVMMLMRIGVAGRLKSLVWEREEVVKITHSVLFDSGLEICWTRYVAI